MAAVFPPPPTNPYQGMAGLRAAWARWQSWITEDLPRQWNEIQALLDGLGGAGVPISGGGGGGGGGGTEFVRNYVVPPEYSLTNLTPEQQVTALGYVASWPSIYAAGVDVALPYQVFDRQISPEAVAVGILSWEVAYDFNGAHAVPFGRAAVDYPGWRVWVPGLRISF